VCVCEKERECVCVCVRERKREKERKCVCVCDNKFPLNTSYLISKLDIYLYLFIYLL
jgi:hypothetical protein